MWLVLEVWAASKLRRLSWQQRRPVQPCVCMCGGYEGSVSECVSVLLGVVVLERGAARQPLQIHLAVTVD